MQNINKHCTVWSLERIMGWTIWGAIIFYVLIWGSIVEISGKCL